jgi:hypothetical protein
MTAVGRALPSDTEARGCRRGALDVGYPDEALTATAVNVRVPNFDGHISLVRMERPAPDLQSADYALDRVRPAAQSRIQMGAGDEERTICGS